VSYLTFIGRLYFKGMSRVHHRDSRLTRLGHACITAIHVLMRSGHACITAIHVLMRLGHACITAIHVGRVQVTQVA
jgi:hypothetical protein